MADNFGLKIGVEGEKEFKKALSDINQTFKVLGSEMKLVSSEFDKQDKSVAAVAARNEVLNKAIDAQKDKIATLESALKNAADSFGENDRRTQNWAIQLNNAKAELNGMDYFTYENETAAISTISAGVWIDGAVFTECFQPAHNCKSCFSAKLVCGDCGGFYGSKVWHSTDKYRRVIWQCNSKFKKGEKCATPHLTEDEIKERFIRAWNGMRDITEEVIHECRLALTELFDNIAIDDELAAKNAEAEVLIEMNRKLIAENASAAQDQKAYKKRQEELVSKYNAVIKRIDELKSEMEKRKIQRTVLTAFIYTMEQQRGSLTEFDESLWLAVVEKATVHADGRLVFTLMDGSEIE